MLSAIGSVWLSTQQTVKTQEIADLNRDIAAKSDRIAELNREIAAKGEEIVASIMGGDSFCYLTFDAPGLGSGTPLLVLVHSGKHPLYEVSIRITDVDRFEEVLKLSGPSFEQLQSADTSIAVGNIFPDLAQVLRRWPSLDRQSKRYDVFIVARNGLTTELIRLRQVNGVWKQALRVLRDKAGKSETLFEKVDAEYPREVDGEVGWK